MTPVWQFAPLAALACATLVMAWASVGLSRRVGAARAASDALTRRVDELSLRIRTVEARKLKATRDDSAHSRPIPTRSATIRRADPGTPAIAATPRLIAVPSLATVGSGTAATEAAEELSRRFGSIWNLADAGEPADAIARATGHPIGQVELILGLRRSSGSASTIEATGATSHV
jgi:hypothetical protein